MQGKLLIVDDEQDLVDLIKSFFIEEGWSVETALDGPEALTKYSDFKPDVILSDINMPQMSGLQMLAKLDAMESETPLIFLSALRDVEKMKLAWGLGAFDFLDKPLNKKDLIDTVNRALEYGKEYTISARKRYRKFKKIA